MCGYITPEEKRVRDAAEDLLEACRTVTRHWSIREHIKSNVMRLEHLEYAVIKCRKAIAKAEGKEGA